MSENGKRIYALGLLNGSLDSQLAIRLLQAQGICVHAVSFDCPFFDAGMARKAAGQLDVPLHTLDFSQEMVAVLRRERCTNGNEDSPACRLCHVMMLTRAHALMQELGCHFVATGEVLGQRPGTQSAEALDYVARQSGIGDLLVRPLSARLLPETEPERAGWVDREKLLAIEGRGHKQQRALAAEHRIAEYAPPTGACRLVDPTFVKRLDDLLKNEGIDGVRSLVLLKYGRHFRLPSGLKMVVGRNEKDNVYLEGNAELYDLLLKVENAPGPTALLPFSAAEDEIAQGASICARYSDAARESQTTVKIRSSRGIRRIAVSPASPDEIDNWRL